MSKNSIVAAVTSFSLFLACLSGAVAFAGAQPFKPALGSNSNPALNILYSFNASVGEFPSAPILASDGNLYGIDTAGSTYSNGGIYRVTPSGKIALVYAFDDPDNGLDANFPLVQGTDGSLYGTTSAGGANGDGVVFRVDASGHYEVLHSFAATSIDGISPSSGLTLGADGNFYDTTAGGGADNKGTIFTITPKGHETVIYSFTGGTDGITFGNPVTRDSSGNLLTVSVNASYSYGEAIQVSSKGVLRWTSVLGASPSSAGIPLSGLTPDGLGGYVGEDANSSGQAIYRLSSKGAYSSLYNFPYSSGVLQGQLYSAGNGSFYGTLSDTVFSVDLSGNEHTVATIGSSPNVYLSITLGTDGAIYGGNSSGGVNGIGDIFKLTSDGSYANLADLPVPNGDAPSGRLLQIAPDVFVGENQGGGRNGDGTIYSVTSTGAVTDVHDFKFTDGAQPTGGLVVAPDGNTYGVTTAGGKFGQTVGTNPDEVGGVIFQVLPNSELQTLHDFSGLDGNQPVGAPVVGPDGALYGVTRYGGDNNLGVIYKCALPHDFHVLHVFSSSDANDPIDGLTLGSDGYLYGTTYGGGKDGDGAIYRILPNGSGYEVVHSFTGSSDGSQPGGAIVELSPGVFYGVATYGGANKDGVAYVYSASTGTVAGIHEFNPTADGYFPVNRLLIGSDGNLYGVATGSPLTTQNVSATFFRLTPAGAVTPLATIFPGENGNIYTPGPLTEGADGNLYGGDASEINDQYVRGCVFQLQTNLPSSGS